MSVFQKSLRAHGWLVPWPLDPSRERQAPTRVIKLTQAKESYLHSEASAIIGQVYYKGMVDGAGIALFLSGQLCVVIVLPGKKLQDLLHLVGGARRRRSRRVRDFELRQHKKLRMVAM